MHQWHMPTADCALPAGTKLLYVDDDSVSWFREVTAPCGLSAARHGIHGRGRVFMRDGSDVPYLDDKRQACTAAALIVSQIFLPATEPAQAPPAPPMTIWHMPIGDCTLPAGTQVGVGDGHYRRLLDPCDFLADCDSRGSRGVVLNRRRRGPIRFQKEGTEGTLTAPELVVFAVLLPASPTSEIRPGQCFEHRHRSGTALVLRIESGQVIYRTETGNRFALNQDSFLEAYALASTSPAVDATAGATYVPDIAAPVVLDAYEQAREKLVARLLSEGQHLAQDVDVSVARVMVTEDNTIDRWEPTTPTAQRRLQLGLNSERPRVRPHPHEGRSERVYQKRLK